MLARITCFIGALFLPFLLMGQKFSVRAYTIKDGLPGNSLQNIMQDSRGYIWISGNGGLTRFDGSNFKNYGVRDGLPNYFSSNTLIEDSAGTIWFSRKDGACGFDGKRFIDLPLSDTPVYFWVTQVHRDRRHKLRFLTSVGIYELENNVWQRRNIPGLPPGTFYNYFEELDNGSWLVNLRDSVIIRTAAGRMVTIARADKDHPVFASVSKTGGRIFVSSRYHLLEYLHGGLEVVHDDVLKNTLVTTALLDREGRLWVGTIRHGIFVFSGNEYQHIDPEELNLWSVNGFCEDAEGNIWAASSNGLIRLRPSFVDIYKREGGAEQRAFRSAYRDRDGVLYFGHVRGGFEIWKDNKLTSSYQALDKTSAKKSDLWIHAFAMDDKHRLWLVNNDLEVMRVEGGRVKTMEPNEPISPNTHTMTYDPSDSAMYLGYQRGLIRIKDDKWYTQRIFKDSTRADLIFIDPYGRIWIATENGTIYRKQGDHIEVVNRELKLDNVSISKILWVNDKNIWIATGGKGVYRYHTTSPGGRLELDLALTSSDGLPNDLVVDMAIDSKNRLWACTMAGLVSIEPGKSTGSSKICSYGEEDGITEVNPLAASIVSDDKGDIWLCTDEGLAHIHTSQVIEDTTPPRIHIEQVSLFNNSSRWNRYTNTFSKFFDIPTVPVLPYDANDISIDFKAVCFSNSKNLRYSYKLEGTDNDWIDVDKNAHLTFGKLMPGSYLFKVRANKIGSAYSNVATFAFVIDPAWWNTWWFRLLATICVLAGLYRLYRYRLAHLMRIQDIRIKIASDLHDDIGSTLNSISVYSEIAAQNAEDRDEALQMIGDSARQTIDNMSDIVWAIDPANDSFEKTVARMRSLTYHLLRARNIEYTFHAGDTISERRISMRDRRNFYLIFKEALNNLVKYSKATDVAIAVSLVDDVVVLRITDDGVGFDADRPSTGNGLHNMKQRAKEMGAQLNIHSMPGKGTIVELVLKKTP